ncbi:unnamed protein product [Closterium sp. NIES-65]|nr:unnamed protein product [Closterium sp. NIES-65]
MGQALSAQPIHEEPQPQPQLWPICLSPSDLFSNNPHHFGPYTPANGGLIRARQIMAQLPPGDALPGLLSIFLDRLSSPSLSPSSEFSAYSPRLAQASALVSSASSSSSSASSASSSFFVSSPSPRTRALPPPYFPLVQPQPLTPRSRSLLLPLGGADDVIRAGLLDVQARAEAEYQRLVERIEEAAELGAELGGGDGAELGERSGSGGGGGGGARGGYWGSVRSPGGEGMYNKGEYAGGAFGNAASADGRNATRTESGEAVESGVYVNVERMEEALLVGIAFWMEFWEQWGEDPSASLEAPRARRRSLESPRTMLWRGGEAAPIRGKWGAGAGAGAAPMPVMALTRSAHAGGGPPKERKQVPNGVDPSGAMPAAAEAPASPSLPPPAIPVTAAVHPSPVPPSPVPPSPVPPSPVPPSPVSPSPVPPSPVPFSSAPPPAAAGGWFRASLREREYEQWQDLCRAAGRAWEEREEAVQARGLKEGRRRSGKEASSAAQGGEGGAGEAAATAAAAAGVAGTGRNRSAEAPTGVSSSWFPVGFGAADSFLTAAPAPAPASTPAFGSMTGLSLTSPLTGMGSSSFNTMPSPSSSLRPPRNRSRSAASTVDSSSTSSLSAVSLLPTVDVTSVAGSMLRSFSGSLTLSSRPSEDGSVSGRSLRSNASAVGHGRRRWRSTTRNGLQQKLVQDVLLLDGTETDVPPSYADVARMLGLAGSLADRQPVSMALCILRVLDMVGQTRPFMRVEEGSDVSDLEREDCEEGEEEEGEGEEEAEGAEGEGRAEEGGKDGGFREGGGVGQEGECVLRSDEVGEGRPHNESNHQAESNDCGQEKGGGEVGVEEVGEQAGKEAWAEPETPATDRSNSVRNRNRFGDDRLRDDRFGAGGRRELVNVEEEMERYAVDKACRHFIVSCLLDLLQLHAHHACRPHQQQPCFNLPATPATPAPTAKGASELVVSNQVVPEQVVPEQVVSEQVVSEAGAPYRLGELAEVLLVESTVATNGMNPIECAHLDRLYLTHGTVQGGLHLGPGILALAVALAMQSLPSLWPDDVAEVAEFLEEMGCEEAGYRARVRVLGSVYATEADCKEVIRRTVRPRGVEPVRRRIQRVVGVAETALTHAPTEASRSAYVRRFCDALMEELLQVLPEALPEAWPEPAPMPPPRSLSGGRVGNGERGWTEVFSPPPLSCPAALPASVSLPNGLTAGSPAAAPAAAAAAAVAVVDAEQSSHSCHATSQTPFTTNPNPPTTPPATIKALKPAARLLSILPVIPDSEAAPIIPWVRDLAEAYLRLSRHLSLDSEGVRQQHERHTDVCACIILRCLVAEVAREREEARVEAAAVAVAAAASSPGSPDAAGMPEGAGSTGSAAAVKATEGGGAAAAATDPAVGLPGNSVEALLGGRGGEESSSADAQQERREREERDAAMAALLVHLDKAPGGTGSLAWKAIGRMLERRNPTHPVLPAVWVRAVLNTHLAVNEEGTGTDVDALELFDWSLESLLVTLPGGPEAAASLLKVIDSAAQWDSTARLENSAAQLGSPAARWENSTVGGCSGAARLSDATRVDVLLAIAARVACTIYWRWPRRRDAPRFVAQVLTLAHGTGETACAAAGAQRRVLRRFVLLVSGGPSGGHDLGATAAGSQDRGAPVGMDHAQPCVPAAALRDARGGAGDKGELHYISVMLLSCTEADSVSPYPCTLITPRIPVFNAQTPEEAREIRESCIISAWYSTSAFRGEEPIELIGSQWPYR